MKKYVNRYTVSGVVVYAAILAACFMGDMVRQGIAIVLATTVLGGICWLCTKALQKKPTVKCVCGGEVTPLANHGACGCYVGEKSPT